MADLTNDRQSRSRKYILFAFLCIAIAAVGLTLMKFDKDILVFIQEYLRNPVFDTVVPIYTTLGEWAIIWIIIGLAMLPFKKYRKCGFWVLIALICGLLICNIAIKNLVARVRPCYLYPEIWETAKLVGDPSEYSFPSGHSVSSMSSAIVIYKHHKKLGIAALAGAVLMGLSRLYVFVHFPTDVFGGFIIGAIIAIGCLFAEKKIGERIKQKKSENT